MNYPIEKFTRKNFPIIDSGFEETTGLSWVTIVTPYGRFTGMARVHPDDLEKGYYTSLSGQSIAHVRAYIEYLKYIKRNKINIYNELLCVWAQAPKKNKTSLILSDKLNTLKNEIVTCKTSITELEDVIKKRIETTAKYYQAKTK